MRSDWSTREMNILRPLTRYLSPRRTAVVCSFVVSEPEFGSVTPKACSRSSPVAIFGRCFRFCSSDVHLRVARGGVATRSVDRLEDQGSLRDPEPGAAVLLRNQRGQVAGLRQLVDELLGVLAPRVELAPVLAGIAPADLEDARPEGALLVRQREVDRGHRRDPYLPLNCGLRFSLKARTPSSRSSVTTVALYASSARIIAVSRSVSRP